MQEVLSVTRWQAKALIVGHQSEGSWSCTWKAMATPGSLANAPSDMKYTWKCLASGGNPQMVDLVYF
jgi:hypothetical protein